MAKKKARKAKPKRAVKTAPVAEPAPMHIEPPVMPVPVEAPVESVVEAPKETPKPHHPHPMTIGVWAYIIGVAVSFIAALYVQNGLDYYTYAVLAVLGFLVALLNITDEEVLLFLVATVAFVVSANSVRTVLMDVPLAVQFLNNVIVFTAASAFLVSMKAIIKVAKSE